MTENKRFEFIGLDNEVIKDNVTGESHWVVEYTQRKRILDLLNEQDKRIQELEKENKQLIKEWFESEKDYIIESYHDNAIRRDEKIEFLKEEFKERFGDV